MATLAPDPPTLAARQLAFMGFLMGTGRTLTWPQVNGKPMPTLTAEAAASVTGSATGESEVRSVNLNKTEGSNGAIQWLGSPGRLADMEAWCTTNFGGWQSLEPQAAYIIYELMTTETAAGKYILNPGARTITTLVFDFVLFDERPANPVADANTRVVFANQCYALLGATPQPTPVPTPTPVPPVTTPPTTTPPLNIQQLLPLLLILLLFQNQGSSASTGSTSSTNPLLALLLPLLLGQATTATTPPATTTPPAATDPNALLMQLLPALFPGSSLLTALLPALLKAL